MNRNYHTLENKIILSGDTFSIKDDIKKMGGKWDSNNKSWWLINTQIAVENILKLGFKLIDKDVTPSQPKQNSSETSQNDTMSVSHFVLFIESIIKKNISGKYWINGEISSFKTSNGHIFFDLIDKEDKNESTLNSLKAASISCILWSGRRQFLEEKISKILFKDGTKIKILVSCDFRKEGSKISAIIDDIDLQFTQGELALQRINIVSELKKLGLYYKNKLLKLKNFTLNIALITADNSRAYSDFIDELKQSKLSFQISLFDCNMQGEKTSENVSKALHYISDQIDLFDCVVITRGGGSRLDLRWFDDLEIAKQIGLSKIPVITAVGHFDDISISDEVSFHSEKTPTAAARYLIDNIFNSLHIFFLRLEKVTHLLLKKTSAERQFLFSIEERLSRAAIRRLESEKRQLKGYSQILKVFQTSITQTLKRGYALVYDNSGNLLKGKDFLHQAPPIDLKLKFASDCENQHIFVDVSVKEITQKSDPS